MESNETGQGPSDETTDKAQITGDINAGLSLSLPVAVSEVEVAAVHPAPTREEAREMFKHNPGLWAVLTDQGNMTRDEA